MSTNVSLIVIDLYGTVPEGHHSHVPFVLDTFAGVGGMKLLNLLNYLDAESAVGHLRFVALDPDPEPGLRRYYIPDPTALFTEIAVTTPRCWSEIWDVAGLLEFYHRYRVRDNLAWYFHAES